MASRRDGSCRNLELVASYSGAPGTFQALAGRPQPPGVRPGRTSTRCMHGWSSERVHVGRRRGVLFVVCSVWWRHAWLTRRFVAAAPVKWLALVAAGCDLAGQGRSSCSPSTSGRRAAALGRARRARRVRAARPGVGQGVRFAGSVDRGDVDPVRRVLPPATSAAGAESVAVPTPVIEGLGVCCSGGGHPCGRRRARRARRPRTDDARGRAPTRRIGARPDRARAGDGWSPRQGQLPRLGVRRRLHRRRLAARRATPRSPTDLAKWPSGVIGDPGAYPSPPPVDADSSVGQGPPSLYRHLQQRREFLRSGRGGLPASAARRARLPAVPPAAVGAAARRRRLADRQADRRRGSSSAGSPPIRRRSSPWPDGSCRSTPRMYGPAVVFAVVAVGVFAVLHGAVEHGTARGR